jgi:2-polyprenyl-3-methyl-5-hydroxy-6-metoxy-1,4-benzoquinol methylase
MKKKCIEDMVKSNEGLSIYGWVTAEPNDSLSYVAPKILAELPPKSPLQILDAGCGNGCLAGMLAEMGHEVIGVDIAEDGISLAKTHYPNVHFEVYSVYDDLRLIVPDVDVVISSEVIEHLYFPRKFLTNIHQVIRPGGFIILTTPYHGYIKNLLLSILNQWDKHHTVDHEGGHIKFFSQKTISRMLVETGFGDIVFNNAGRAPWLWKSIVCRAIRNA